MRLEAISTGRNPPDEVNVDRRSAGGRRAHQVRDGQGLRRARRRPLPLHGRCAIPGNYGFIPHTLSDDGDPCDVLIANQRGIVPGRVLAVRPVGVLKMQDEAGGDEKIIAVPVPRLTRRYENVHNYTDLPEITVHQIAALLRALQGSGNHASG